MFIYLLRKTRKLKYILVFNIVFGDSEEFFILFYCIQLLNSD